MRYFTVIGLIPVPILAKSKLSRLQLVSVAEQAGWRTGRKPQKTGFLMTWLTLRRLVEWLEALTTVSKQQRSKAGLQKTDFLPVQTDF